MTTHSPLQSNKNEDLRHRLMILEKFIELKSNECAYYRTKVHLMQMSSSASQEPANAKRSSSEEISQSSTVSAKPSIGSSTQRYRTNSMPPSAQKKATQFSHSSIPFVRSKDAPIVSLPRKFRKIKKISAQNQNHYEDNAPNERIASLQSNPLNQFLSTYVNQHLQQALAQNNNDPCNEQEPRPAETLATSTQAILIIRLPRRFIASLVKQQKRSSAPKLKVHISSELLHKLLQTIHDESSEAKKHHQRMDKFTIQSQFGALRARVERKNMSDRHDSKVVHARAEVKAHGEYRMPAVRHIARARPDPLDRHSMVRKHRHQRRKKRHTHAASSTSQEETYSKRSSTTNLTQSTRTLPSST